MNVTIRATLVTAYSLLLGACSQDSSQGSGNAANATGSSALSGGQLAESGGTLSSSGGNSTANSGGVSVVPTGGSGATTLSAGGATASGGTLSSSGGSSVASGGSNDASIAVPTVTGPCDIFASASPSTPCVAAHSTVRALFDNYDGKLYQIRRADNATQDITTLTTGGFADGQAQSDFCLGTSCVITVLYDQTGNGNDLWYQGSTEVPGSPASSPADAMTEQLKVSGNLVYSLYIKPGNSYWRDGSQTGVPTGTEPEGIYMVTSGTHYNGGCCFDYGNSETTRKADAAGAMDAIYFGSSCWFENPQNPSYKCTGGGPWVQADLEWGLYSSDSQSMWNSQQMTFMVPYVTAMLKNNGTTEFSLKGSDATTGTLATLYKGQLPGGYSPMKKQGAIVLGSGGDCCKPDGGANLSEGTFYEGAIVSGYPSDATDDLIQANIVAAGYGKDAQP